MSSVGRSHVSGVSLFALLLASSCSSEPRKVDTRSETTTAILQRSKIGLGALQKGRTLRRSEAGFVDGTARPTGFHARPVGGELVAQLPAHAADATRLSFDGHPDTWLEIRGVGLSGGEAHVDAKALIFRDALPDTDVVHVALDRAVEELRVLRSPKAKSSARWTMRHGAGIREVRLRDGRVEALDTSGAIRFATAPLAAEDAEGRALAVTARLEGSVLTIDTDLQNAAFPVVLDPKWIALAAWPLATTGNNTIVAMGGDKYMVAGGIKGGVGSDEAAIYNLTTDTWTVVGALNTGRFYHRSAALPDGSVLVMGGVTGASTYISSVERYNPTTSGWDVVAPMKKIRAEGTSVLTLQSGKVLAVGGYWQGGGYPNSDAEVYDPGANTWTLTGVLPGPSANSAVYQENATTVMAAGSRSAPLRTVNRLNLSTLVWSAAPSLIEDGYYHTGLFKSGSKLLFVAGIPASMQLFDPSTSTWTSVTSGGQNPGVTLDDGTTLLGDAPFLWNPATETYAVTATSSTVNWLTSDQSCLMAASGNRAVCLHPTAGSAVFINKLPASACTSDSECASGFCTDGVCCDKRCNSACQACAESGSVGTCKTVTGAPRGTRTACTGSGPCAPTCNGVSLLCTPPPATTVCTPAACSAGSFTPDAFCNGSGTCVAATSVACGAYACTTSGCATTCAGDGDCASGKICMGSACVDPPVDAGTDTGMPDTGAPDTGTPDTGTPDTFVPDTFVPDTEPVDTGVADTEPVNPIDASGTPTVSGSFQTCTNASECASGFCVDGVCCDNSCEGNCKSCALPTSPGKCALAPLGIDPRGLCGGGEACLSTCDGAGTCRTAFTGAQCAPSKCTSASTGTGAAFCAAKGAACPSGDITFDCGAYACQPAFGACAATCKSTDDCAPGNVCDIASGRCSAAPPASDEGGCTLGHAAEGESATSALLLLAAVYAARRRRTSAR